MSERRGCFGCGEGTVLNTKPERTRAVTAGLVRAENTSPCSASIHAGKGRREAARPVAALRKGSRAAVTLAMRRMGVRFRSGA